MRPWNSPDPESNSSPLRSCTSTDVLLQAQRRLKWNGERREAIQPAPRPGVGRPFPAREPDDLSVVPRNRAIPAIVDEAKGVTSPFRSGEVEQSGLAGPGRGASIASTWIATHPGGES